MSAYYPEGSMAGSGIDATVQPYDAWCDAFSDGPHNDCAWHGDIDLHIDDHGHGSWECPRCGAFHDVERADPREYL